MAHVQDEDISLWLENKLGSKDRWLSNGPSFCAQLNPERLASIPECFHQLQDTVKVKLLLSILHIPKRTRRLWKDELEKILEIARADGDHWVQTMAEILMPYASSESFNLGFESNEDREDGYIFKWVHDFMEDFSKELANRNKDNEKSAKELNMLPLECLYLNKTALENVTGTAESGLGNENVQHFRMKRKSKADQVRMDLLAKSGELNAKKKTTAPVVPLRSRGMPMKLGIIMSGSASRVRPIQNQASTSGGGAFLPSSKLVPPDVTASRPLSYGLGAKKEGGIKLLDISEQPHLTPVGSGLRTLLPRKRKNKEQDELEKDQPISKSPIKEAPRPPPERTRPVSYAPDIGSPAGIRRSYSFNVQSRSVTAGESERGSGEQPAATSTSVVCKGHSSRRREGTRIADENVKKAESIIKAANRVSYGELSLIRDFMDGSVQENPMPNLGQVHGIMLGEHEERRMMLCGAYTQLLVGMYFVVDYGSGEWRIERYERPKPTV